MGSTQQSRGRQSRRYEEAKRKRRKHAKPRNWSVIEREWAAYVRTMRELDRDQAIRDSIDGDVIDQPTYPDPEFMPYYSS